MDARDPRDRTITRRALLTGAAALGLGAAAGCTGSGRHSPGAAGERSGGPARTTAALPATAPWRPGRGEIRPAVKLRATGIVEALGAWRPGGGGADAARQRVSALGLDPRLADEAGPLLGAADTAALQVVDAQYGGLLDSSASVLVVCRQWTRTGAGPVVPGGTTVDVRLAAASPHWAVTALHPAQPGPALHPPPALAREVLAQPRITLPPAAQADLRSGLVHDSVLRAMLTLAQHYTFEVSVVRSGHPLDVFGTSRPSDHPRGRAFDTWRIDGRPVVDPATPRALVADYMRAAAAAGSYNVGGPVQLSGGGSAGQFFSDATHHDHVHAGFAG